jgi:transitional endoplasmic reticulum ATPase
MSQFQQTFKKGDHVNDLSIQFFIDYNDDAEIYRVKNTDGQTLRLKLYPFHRLSQLRFTEEGCLREFDILSSIDHESVIKAVDSGEIIHGDRKYVFITTEFISGESLHEKLKREGTLNPYNVIPTAIRLLEAIDYLQSLDDPVIHNDICPENIIMNYAKNTEIPVLTNFSSAVYLSKSTRTFRSALLNPFYMPPEHHNGITMPQSDLFSVGALIYHLCFGTPPWYFDPKNGEDFQTILQNKRKSKLTFNSSHPDVFDDYFLEVLSKSLAPDLNYRFKDAKEFIAALNRETNIQLSTEQDSKSSQGQNKRRKGNGFKDIAGMDELKDILYNDIIRAINEPELYKSYGITIPNGMLLYGPPGCGKTFISEKFAEEVGFNFIKFNPSDVKSKYVNATEENIGKIFKEAEEQAPSILFFDEVDALMPNRDSNLHHMNASTVNEFLAQMSNCGERGIFIIAATNRPDKIDPAVLRSGRIDKKVYISPPDNIAREQLFRLYLKSRPIDFSIDYSMLAGMTEFWVSSDIRLIVDESSRVALKNETRITQGILLNEIKKSIPSISREDLKYYEIMRDKLEDKNKQSPTRRPVGFRKNE